MAAIGTGLVRTYALRIALLDQPNARSSHTVATARGGGVAIVVSVLLAASVWALLAPTVVLPTSMLLAAALVALVGWIDDHQPLSASKRLLVQGLAAAWVVHASAGMPDIPLFGHLWHSGLVGYVIAWLFLVWSLNLFNFMDGIDGIASSQAITVCLGAAICHILIGVPVGVAPVAIFVAAASFGFLLWNWSPARIFMGDAGSGFLGFFIAALSLQAALSDGRLFWCWIVMMAVFNVDATLTLLRRLFNGERVFDAHRSHAYQQASRHWRAHRPITLAVIAINVFWLLPLAVCIALAKLDGLVAAIVAYSPLLVLALYYRAGVQEADSALSLRE